MIQASGSMLDAAGPACTEARLRLEPFTVRTSRLSESGLRLPGAALSRSWET